MEIHATLTSAYNSASSTLGACKDNAVSLGQKALEVGKMGYNKTVSAISNNPKAALIGAVGTAAIATVAGLYTNDMIPSLSNSLASAE